MRNRLLSFLPFPRRNRLLFSSLGILLVWNLFMQSGCLTMRTPDSEWRSKLNAAGQTIPPHFFNTNATTGRKVHAISIAKDTSLPVVLFVHGSPGSADAFLDYLADTVLSAQGLLVSMDRPGFGYTSGFGKPEPSMAAQSAAVLAVLDSLGAGKKALLVGHSMGCPIAVYTAMHYPGRVTGLVLLGASVAPQLEPHYWWSKVLQYPPVKWLVPCSLWTSNAEILPLKSELESMLPNWTEVRCPVTMIQAKDDRLVPYGNVAFAKEHLINCTDYKEVLLEKGDHFVVWSRHDMVRDVILERLLAGTDSKR